jgi:putative transcriptional regulator
VVTKAKKAKPKNGDSRLTRELLETARDMHAIGLLPKAARDKITMRHLGAALPPTVSVKLTGPEIKALREKVNLSQAVFAYLLNLTVGYVLQLERGAKSPSGPALVSLDVIRRKGIEAIL